MKVKHAGCESLASRIQQNNCETIEKHLFYRKENVYDLSINICKTTENDRLNRTEEEVHRS